MRHQDNPEEPKVQLADPAARARARWLFAASIAVVGVLAATSMLFEVRFDSWFQDITGKLVARPALLFMTLFVAMLPMLGVSVYVFYLGRRIVTAQRMPYPGQKVIKDVPVIRGAAAVRRGRIVQAIAVVMGLFSLSLPFIPPLFMLYLTRGT